MSSGFVHSVKVPRLYKTAANIVRSVREDGGSLKTLIYQKKHPNVSGIYALTLNTLQRGTQLDYLIRKTRILLNEPRLDPWLARVLITELIWGKQCLKTDCKPVQTILTYEKELREELKNADEIDTPPLCKLTARKPRYVRVNTILFPPYTVKPYFKREGWSLIPRCSNYSSHLEAVKSLSDSYYIQDFHIPEVFIFPPEVTFHDHGCYLDGKIVLQDKASCLPAYFLNPEPGSTILDMCAAPGMKTSHLAAIIKNQGKIYAVEIDERRYRTLCDQVKITNSICVEPIHKDVLSLDVNQCPDIDYILVDPSCSGSGMSDRKLIDSRNEKCDPARLKSLQAFQVFLLRHALFSFPTVKRVIYSTCSLNPEENEQVVDEVLKEVNDAYQLVPAKDIFGEEWINYSSKEYDCSDKCLYAKPEVDFCNGFFVAIFERNFDVPLVNHKRKGNGVINEEDSTENQESVTEQEKSSRKRKKRGKKKHKNEEDSDNLQTEKKEEETIEARAEPINEIEEESLDILENQSPKKKKKKSKHKNREQPEDEEIRKEEDNEEVIEVYDKRAVTKVENVIVLDSSDEETRRKTKKKKRKNKIDSPVAD